MLEGEHTARCRETLHRRVERGVLQRIQGPFEDASNELRRKLLTDQHGGLDPEAGTSVHWVDPGRAVRRDLHHREAHLGRQRVVLPFRVNHCDVAGITEHRPRAADQRLDRGRLAGAHIARDPHIRVRQEALLVELEPVVVETRIPRRHIRSQQHPTSAEGVAGLERVHRRHMRGGGPMPPHRHATAGTADRGLPHRVHAGLRAYLVGVEHEALGTVGRVGPTTPLDRLGLGSAPDHDSSPLRTALPSGSDATHPGSC